MLIDTHAHLDDKQYKKDREKVIERSFSSGVSKIINIGAGLGSSQRSVKLSEEYENIFVAVGLHPHYFNEYGKKSFDKFEEFKKLSQHKKVVAIGEVGLDYHSHTGTPITEKQKELQKEGFLKQIDLSLDLDLPLVIHCRDAYEDVLNILKENKKNHGKKLRGAMHSYLGRLSYAKEFVSLGFSLGFNGIITFARDYDKVIKETELKHILIETDCPYLAPLPYRGERNEPSYVRYVAEKIGEIKEISLEEVEETTTENAQKLFGI